MILQKKHINMSVQITDRAKNQLVQNLKEENKSSGRFSISKKFSSMTNSLSKKPKEEEKK